MITPPLLGMQGGTTGSTNPGTMIRPMNPDDAPAATDPTRLPRANPFATARIRPGRIPYAFPAGSASAAIAAALDRAGGRGQIVGPHGSGKSTLRATLADELARRGRGVVATALHDGARRLPPDFLGRLRAAPAGAVAIIDGFEQLPWWRRRALAWRCRRLGLGLVVTCHAPVGLPTLWETAVSPDLAWSIIRGLMPDAESLVGRDEVAGLLAAHSGSLRELLFELYDRFEERRPQGDPPDCRT